MATTEVRPDASLADFLRARALSAVPRRLALDLIGGALIAGVGCLRGLQTRQGPSAVGESTTRSVVSGILLVIVADAVVAVLLYFLHL